MIFFAKHKRLVVICDGIFLQVIDAIAIREVLSLLLQLSESHLLHVLVVDARQVFVVTGYACVAEASDGHMGPAAPTRAYVAVAPGLGDPRAHSRLGR